MSRFALDHASAEYKEARARLLAAEEALRDRAEAVAALRRALPADTPVTEDYAFTELVGGGRRTVTLSDLFGAQPTLILMHFMWAPADDDPCPMCALWADGYDGIQPHLRQRTAFAVAVKKDIESMAAFAARRGWTGLRLVSSAGTNFNRDFGMEDEDEGQRPGVSVFIRAEDGSVRHFYTVSAGLGDGSFRGMDLLSPVWNYLDLLPHGRGDFMPKLAY